MSAQQADKRPAAWACGNTDTSLLKIIALVSMIIDHVGVAFFPDVRELRVLGRIAMPLYAWCLVVGSEYTHNALRYALRLFVLGVISQPLYIMVLGNSWSELNILFLFCIGVLGHRGHQKKCGITANSGRPRFVYCVFAVSISITDGTGFLFILLLYYCARYSKSSLAAAFWRPPLIWGDYSFSVIVVFRLAVHLYERDNLFRPSCELFFQLQALMWLALPLILIPNAFQYQDAEMARIRPVSAAPACP